MASALSIITIAATGLSAGASILGGFQQANQLEFQAQQAETQAKLETVRAKQRANLIRDRLNQDLASANATSAARGVLSTQGSARQAQIQSAANASRDIDAVLFGGAANASQLESQADQFRSGATAAKFSGFLNAATRIGSSPQLNPLGDI